MLAQEAICQLRSQFRGAVIDRKIGLRDARKVYNAMIDRKPCLIAQARTWPTL